MIFDLNNASDLDNRISDVVIVGAGAAGIYLALALEKHGKKITLLEGGGLDYSDDSQLLYDGISIGKHHLPYGLKDSRMRFLGGSTNCRAGGCARLDNLDFKKRIWIENSGWPIEEKDLHLHYNNVEKFLQISQKSEPIETDDLRLNHFNRKFLKYTPIQNFNSEFYDRLNHSQNISLVLNSNVSEFLYDGTTTKNVTGVKVINRQKRRFIFRGRDFIISCGGIASTTLLQGNLGIIHENAQKNIGHYFSDHPIAPCASLLLKSDRKIKTAQDYWVNDLNPFYSLSEDIQERHRLANCAIQIFEEGASVSSGTASALKLRSYLKGESNNFNSYDAWNILSDAKNVYKFYNDRKAGVTSRLSIRFQVEDTPNYESKLTVEKKDVLYQVGKPILDWNVSDKIMRTIWFNLAYLSKSLISAGIGILKIDPQLVSEPAELPTDLRGGQHHCGTLRMAATPNLGVVDANLKLFGADNVFICSSAVFPTNGWVNPTLTILALADRLVLNLVNKQKIRTNKHDAL
jgi:hypothetical protein